MKEEPKVDAPFILLLVDDDRPILVNVNQIAVVTMGKGATHLHMASGNDIHVTGAAEEVFLRLAERSVSLAGDSLAGVMGNILKELERND